MDRSGSDPPDPRRPNKWRGHSSTWKSYTDEEREVSRKVDLSKARDLGAHLYNAHALRVRARKLRAEFSNVGGDAQAKVWEPPIMWSSWPLRSNEVPRTTTNIAGQLLEANPVPNLMGLGVCSSRNLEDALLALFTLISRERTREKTKAGVLGHLPRDTQSTSGREGKTVPSDHDAHGIASISPRAGSKSFPNQDRPNSSDEDTRSAKVLSIERDQNQGREIFEQMEVDDEATAQEQVEAHSGPPKPSTKSRTSPEQYRPIPIVDDDVARRIAQPSLGHILASFETLLRGLHHTRHYQRGTIKRPVPQPRKRKHPPTTISKSGKQGEQERNTSAGKRRLDLSNDAETDGTDSRETSSNSESESSPMEVTPNQSRKNLGLTTKFDVQGWRDVLGIAAIQGWEKDVLERSQARCIALFGERMGLTEIRLDRQATGDNAYKNETEGGVRVDGFLRPIKKQKLWTRKVGPAKDS
ncbi:hypothetical protein MMC10_010508 [Thelotrema lepadinum]|nr:hypothetical protein [Thelotrema lepadinum]